MAAAKRRGKGEFGEAGLPVAKGYPPTARRNRWLAVGAVAVAGVTAVVLFDLVAGGGRFVSNGPLASAHAAFESECANCHRAAGAGVVDEACSACHEKLGDELGLHTFSAHYLYRSDDFRRVVPAEGELPCIACHPDHRGREAALTRVPDTRCAGCHEDSAFDRGHPEFDALAEGAVERPGLSFAHDHHVREVMKRRELVDLERSCLACHNPEADGRGFGPIEFDRHCDACHLGATLATPALPRAADGEVGVETVEEIRASGRPGTRWALFSDPNEVRVRGSSVVKGPLYHPDPWVLDNLRRLRRELFPDAGLADLLTASADAEPWRLRELYLEAIANLEEQLVGLRGLADRAVQTELQEIEATLAALRRAVNDPYAPLDETRFELALERRDPELAAERLAAIEAVVADLTEPCRACHQVEDATIVRVQKDQQTFRRAEFDHRAHILQRRCLDCHAAIAIDPAAPEPTPAADDRAETLNLPSIDSCRACHDGDQVSQRCVTCHLFHPGGGRPADLLLYSP